mmetsp:Transcript_15079/g.22449  ORF Transcript_15079/g.22449 Transcript_15079/m.22449 type:complete len:359 (-) Transcript_15079:36-1112(-)
MSKTENNGRNFNLDKSNFSSNEHLQREQRAKRFQINRVNDPSIQAKKSCTANLNGLINSPPSEVDSKGGGALGNLTVKGTSTELEKEYFRLTSAPDPSTVRPSLVLKKALERLISIWNRRGTTDPETNLPVKVDYLYMCSQLKAIRQDLTVQRLKGPLAVSVYEGHARIALEEDDLNEYNQCQTQLKELYASGENGAVVEFTAYRILYHVVLHMHQSYVGGNADILIILSEIPNDQKNDQCIIHALRVREAVASFNYYSFFKLLKEAPNLGKKIMNSMVSFMRLKGLERIIKAYRPTVPTSFVIEVLSLEDSNELGTDRTGITYLNSCGLVLSEDGSQVKCKESIIKDSVIMAGNSLL